MKIRSIVLLGVVVGSWGCATTQEGDRVASNVGMTDVNVRTPPASNEGAQAASREAPAPVTDGFVLGAGDGKIVPIGKACAARSPEERGHQPENCGTKGRVSLEYDGYGFSSLVAPDGKLPCELQPIVSGKEDQMSAYRVSACTNGDFLLVSTVCVMCRMAGGQNVHAKLSELSEDQRTLVYETLHLPGGEAPADADGWRKVLAANRPRAASK